VTAAGFDPKAFAKQATGRTNGAEPDKPDGPRALDLVWADDIETAIDQAGLIDGLLGTTGLTVAYGESGCGKTFVIVDLSCHVAAKMPWRGLEVEQGVVVYVAAEGPRSVERRIWAWMQHHGLEHLALAVIRSSVDLLHGDAEAILAALASIKAKHGRIALVVIDTLARAMLGNENSPEDMGRFVAACASIREAAETHVLIVHHCGKEAARGARGHSSLRAATDVELEITKGEAGGCIRVSKARDEHEGAAFGFRLEPVELGTNPKGRTITTCVAVEADPPAAGGKKRLGANERLVFDALAAAIADQPDPAPPAPDIPSGVQGASVARWQDAAMRYLPQTETKRRREAFNRALTSLVANHAVRHADGFAWLP
jgi:hypothetical protein